jgi:hypothetical protein
MRIVKQGTTTTKSSAKTPEIHGYPRLIRDSLAAWLRCRADYVTADRSRQDVVYKALTLAQLDSPYTPQDIPSQNVSR